MTSPFPIPLTILTGFLGAGKTTLLNRILHGDHGLRIAVLVNDFGAINIDSQLVVDVDQDDTIELSNGCICCTIRGDLLQAMVNVTRREQPPEYIIIEASGVSDPLEIAMTFQQPQLKALITIDSVLTVVDAEQVRDLDRENEVLAVLQIGAADIVVLNKVDLVTAEALQEVKQWVRSIIPQARIFETTHGQVPLPLIIGVGAFSTERLLSRPAQDIHVHESGVPTDHDHDHDHSMVFSTWSWTSDQPLALRAVQRTVDNLPPNIFRAKGFLYLADDPARVAILQVVGKRVTLTWGEPWGETPPHTQFVVIAEHGTIDAEDLRARFDRCLASEQSALERLTGGVLTWLRGRGTSS
jgi:G3E family GTPase